MRKRPAFIEVAPRPVPATIAAREDARIENPGSRRSGSAKNWAANLLQQAIELFNANEFEQAAEIANQILLVEANNVNALRIAGVAERKANRFDRAGDLFDTAIRLAPKNAFLFFERGLTWLEQHRHREAYACFLQATRLDPKFQPAFVNLSAILEQQERFEEAMHWAKQASELKPQCFLGLYNLANTLRECGRVAEAIEYYERVTKLNPGYVKAGWNLGICHVLLGNFAKAWPLFELREATEEVKIDKYTQPRWDGSSLKTKTIVVHAEQGIGDEVLFASCFDDVIAQAGKTIVTCEPRLLKLFTRSFPAATVCSWTRRKDWSPMPIAEPVDFQIPAGSLPLYLRNRAEDFPKRGSFLVPDAALVAEWRKRFAAIGGGLKIGLSWRAGGKANEGRKRTIPLTDWHEILATPGVQFVNLQYSDASEDLAEVKSRFGVHVHDWEQGDPLVDMDSYAAKIAALDLVISVGNAAVHLAGALGTPAWAMLPRVPSWRWMVTGDVSPWYSSVRLFRQPARREWTPVLGQIAERLREVSDAGERGESIETLREQVRAVMPQNELPEAAPISPPKNQPAEWLAAEELGSRQPLAVIQSLQERADAALAQKDWEEAEYLFREIIQVTPRHLNAHAGLGRVAMETGRTDLAIRSFQRALNMYEPHALNHAYLAAALLDAERFEEALAHAGRAAAIDGQSNLVQLQLGRTLQAVQRHAEAISVFERVLNAMPNDPEGLAGLCRSLVATGRLDEALRILKTSKTLVSEPLLQLALGEVLLDDQCFAEAEKCFSAAIWLDANFAPAHFQLARLCEARGEIEQAIVACRRAVEIRPQWLSALVFLTTLHGANGELREAEAACRQALALRPECVELQIALGNLLAEQGNHAAAVAVFEGTLHVFPDHEAAQHGRAISLELLGESSMPNMRLDVGSKMSLPRQMSSAGKPENASN